MSHGVNRKLLLVIMDGVGLSEHTMGNAVQLAYTPVLDGLLERFPRTVLKAHGRAVGMPSDKDMGNSEVGHNALGSGQVFDQGAKLVQNALDSGALFQGETWRAMMRKLRGTEGQLHLIGLLSDGNVHSHIQHVEALLKGALKDQVGCVRLHILLDGRDVGERTAHLYIERLEAALAQMRTHGMDARIASGGGRMVVTMDRYEADWDIVARGWQHHVLGKGRRFPSAMDALNTLRQEDPDMIDQFCPGFVVADESGPLGPVLDGDAVVFFNFRGDRAIEITRAFEGDSAFDKFDRERVPRVFYAGMMQYDGDLKLPTRFLVVPPCIDHTLTQHLVAHGVRQYAISETQKFGHVTYFWNGNRSGVSDPETETFVEVPSDRVPFEQRPWMKAAEISDTLIQAIRSRRFDFLRVNYANGDMVGHTGKLAAAVSAVSAVDLQLGRVLRVARDHGLITVVTADHGNAEKMLELDKQGQPVFDASGEPKTCTSHTLNPVPLVVVDPGPGPTITLKQEGMGLSHVAATITQLMGLKPDPHWDESLIV